MSSEDSDDIKRTLTLGGSENSQYRGISQASQNTLQDSQLSFASQNKSLPSTPATQDFPVSQQDFNGMYNDLATNAMYDDIDRDISNALESLRVTTNEDSNLHKFSVDVASSSNENATPYYACKYCNISDPACVAMCNQCKQWFCNSRLGISSSHIVCHLVRSKHKEVVLHKDSALGESLLECYHCKSRNVFTLGFIPTKSDSVIILLCRTPCSQFYNAKDLNNQSVEWQPLITEKTFLNWLIEPPTEEQMKLSLPITMAQIVKLEELMKVNPKATVMDTSEPQEKSPVEPVSLMYRTREDYSNVMAPLVKLEADYDKMMKESRSQEGLTVRWATGLNHKRVAYFLFPQSDNEELRLMHGDELILSYKGISSNDLNKSTWSAKCFVIKVSNVVNDEIGVELIDSKMKDEEGPFNHTTGFTIDFVWKSTSFSRMIRALKDFFKSNSCMSEYIANKLLGQDVPENKVEIPLPKRYSAPSLPELNHSQGPPGTGKTVTSATIVYHLAKRKQEKFWYVLPAISPLTSLQKE